MIEMGLKNFDAVPVFKTDDDDVEDVDENNINIGYKNIKYYLFNLDELVNCVEDNYVKYIDAKMEYEHKKDRSEEHTSELQSRI